MAIRIALSLLIAAACAATPTTPTAPPRTAPPPPEIHVPAADPASPQPPKDESLAKCLARKGVRLFGAYWCQPCHDQLELFGKDAPDVPYTDCQPEGSLGNIPECDKLDIQNYPTWLFPDGYKALGVRSLKWLSESTSCPLR